MERAHKKPRKDCKYSAKELEQIQAFKKEFIMADTIDKRATILKTQILPAMCNYWVSTGQLSTEDIDDSLDRAKELSKWVANNWRTARGVATRSNHFHPKKSEVMWYLHPEEVMKEVASLLGVEEATTTTTGWFQERLPAIANILARMSPTEKAEFEAEVAKMAKEGYPEETKRSIAKRFSTKRIAKVMDEHWKEMGLVSIMITAYTLPDGKLVIDAHDEIADLMGIPARSLIDSHPEEISKMKLLLMDYMKTLRTKAQVPVAGGIGTNPGLQKVLLTTTSEGYPMLPEPWRNGDESKKKLEELFSLYIGRHYKLATNGRTVHPPYAAIIENHAAYFSPEYLPPSFTVKHPRNLTKLSLEAFFDHIEARQKDHGPTGAFRFKSIKHGDTLLPAKYPASAADAGAGAGAAGRRKAKTRKTKTTAKKTKRTKAANTKKAPNPVNDPNTSATSSHQGPGAGAVPSEERLPDATTDLTNSEAGDNSFVIVNEYVMAQIHAAGYPMPLPVNGPADGLPKYAIDSTTYRAYEQLQDANERHTNPTNPHRNIDPALLHPPLAPMPTPAATPAPETRPGVGPASAPAHASARARHPRQAHGPRTITQSSAPAVQVTPGAMAMAATLTAEPVLTQGRRVPITPGNGNEQCGQ
ncbi:hypothetical protein BDZ97DRAFT_1923291 [Flammula alnicola]|nr:hypothetical protein BDZ97DRAFT_1923291 [Flammula alnicola]